MPVIKCTKDGKPGFKVEGTPGCAHKTREAAVKQLQAIKSNQAKSLTQQVLDNLDAAKHDPEEDEKNKKKNKEEDKKKGK